MRIRTALVMCLAAIILVSGGCAASFTNDFSSFNSKLYSIVRPYSFNYVSWEITTLFKDVVEKVKDSPEATDLNSQSVVHYFSYVTQLNSLKSDLQMVQAGKIEGDVSLYEDKIKEAEEQVATLKPTVEETLARQISEVLTEQGIDNPFIGNRFKIIFPPVNFKLEEPLNVLIVSPRDKIESIRDITIKQDITTSQKEEIESSLSGLNVSALVVEIGGLGATYPSFVINNADLRFTIDTSIEEWLHQYLAFKPLGFRYVLDLLRISPDPDIPTINETLAGIASRELGALVYDQFYSQYQTDNEAQEGIPVKSGFDFDSTMREIRKNVDNYLAQGQIDEAEKYMEEQRQYLISNGYYIRKLNQAYFAFYGSYAYSGTSIDPIGDEINLLRENSPSLADFIETASKLTSRQALSDLVSQYQ